MGDTDKEVTIRITGKNLTDADFAAARKNLAGLKDGGKDANDSLDKIWSGLKTGAGLIGVTFGAEAVVGFAGKIFDTASSIKDMSTALGVSTEAYQRNAFAASQSGGSAEAYSKAQQRLNDALAGGEKSTVAALKSAGLEMDKIRAMKPEEAWLATTKAVGQIEDPLLRAHVAQDLYGKGALALLPGMIEGYDKLGAAAVVMSDKTIDRLEAAQDQWDAFWNAIVIHSGEALGSIGELGSYKERIDKAIQESSLRTGKTYDEERSRVEHLSRAQQEAFLQQIETGPKVADVYDHKMSPAQAKYWAEVNKVVPKTSEQEAAEKKAAAAAKAHADEIQKLADTMSGKAVATKIEDYAAALKLAEKNGGLTAQQSKALAKELDGLVQQGGKLPPTLSDIWREYVTLEFNQKAVVGTTGMLTKGVQELTAAHVTAKPALDAFNSEVDRMLGLAKAAGGPDSLNAIKNLGTEVDKLTPPPKDPWEEWKRFVKDEIFDGPQGIVANTTQTIFSLSRGWDGFWTSAKNTALKFFDDVVGGLAHRFLEPMLAQLIGSKSTFGKAIGSLFDLGGSAGSAVETAAATAGKTYVASLGSEIALTAPGTVGTALATTTPAVSSAASSAGSIAGAGWAGAFGAAAGIGAGFALMYYLGGGKGDKYTAPDARTGDNADPYSINNPFANGFDPGNPNRPETGEEGGNPNTPEGGVDPGYSGHEGYATGGIAARRQYALIAEHKKEIVGDMGFMTNALTAAVRRVDDSRGRRGGSGGGGVTEIRNVIMLEGKVLQEFVSRTAQLAAAQGRLQIPASAVTQATPYV